MTDPARTPVVVGVGDLRSGRAGAPADPREPLDLIHDAAGVALADTGVDGIARRIDAVYAVKTASWAYDDLPALLAARLGAAAARTHTSPLGGHWPAALLDRIGHEIATGTTGVALLVGGESQASVTAATKAGTDPAALGWTTDPGGPPAFDPDDLGSPAMQRAGMLAPTRVYPLFETRLSHELGHSHDESLAWSAQLYAAFSEIAGRNPTAWNPDLRTAEDITTVGPRNRMVTAPYPLLLNAMPFVDQAAAVVVTSLATARELGVAEDRIVYVWGGAGATEPADILARAGLGRSAALADALARTLERTDLRPADLDIVDAYSCFPVVPKLLVEHLGLPRETVPSVTGGHSFFGGPLNSYTLHSLVAVTRRLRTDGEIALVHGNGGYLTYQHTVVLAAAPHTRGYVGDPEPHVLPATGPDPAVGYSGDVEIHTATAEYGRDGHPAIGFLVGTTPDGRRVSGYTDAAGAQVLAAGADIVGRTVHVVDRGGALTVTLTDPVTEESPA
ncbi:MULTISPECIES: acetyl-CoA acetyltransferase [Rhodococcus]|uniref:acetyl-CoA acetyltransferase n=1 Tax=Rhodococcus TaxID=1827 RepID=UPI000C7C4E63|nr:MULTISPECIES: acetyl-CoA acetyltransferase [Rhodococcus]AUM16170.1 acetyl-CoA acetyltransferase [Rhodococcus ruber]MBD8052558.1 acetyl-CoA acetyltransferase [Rhodococcus ruber]MCF8783808.1 acetyl-CoA acetyltransferase [Rhodococcus ruber]